jgi:hypothetical protein
MACQNVEEELENKNGAGATNQGTKVEIWVNV